MPKNACDEPIVLTEREQFLMQELIEKFELWGGRGLKTPAQQLECTTDEWVELRSKFF